MKTSSSSMRPEKVEVRGPLLGGVRSRRAPIDKLVVNAKPGSYEASELAVPSM